MIRIERVTIENVRAIESVELALSDGLTVLIGENGSCKSTVVECLELLRKAASPTFLDQVNVAHRGMDMLLRQGCLRLKLGIRIASSEDHLGYEFELERTAQGGVRVASEWLRNLEDGFSIVRTDASGRLVWNGPPLAAGAGLAITAFGSNYPDERMRLVVQALEGIEVHLGFDTLAVWAASSAQRTSPLRGSSFLQPAERLDLLGQNLANAWQALISHDDSERYRQALRFVQLGLGDAVESVLTKATPGGGQIALSLKRRGMDPIPAARLSDGQLTWLCWVAAVLLNDRRVLFVVDEPELHLHPYLIAGVVSLLQAAESPVLIATHSDHVLESIDDPVAAVRVSALDDRGRATLAGLDAAEWETWRAHYRDVGQLRAAGYLQRVVRASGSEDAG